MSEWWDDPAFDKPRGVVDRFKDAYIEGAANSEVLGAATVMRQVFKRRGYSEEQIDAALRKIVEDKKRRNAEDPAIQDTGKDILSPNNIGRMAVDLVGNLAGGIDPTYVISAGKNAAQRILTQAGVNAGADVVSQTVQKNRKIRDKYDPVQTGVNFVAGGLFQGGGEVARGVRTASRISRGRKLPNWQDVNDVIVRDLEGGGTLERPKVSPKGAMGPQQVMPETARKPGFGIRPWNGKTQADLARVGRQYTAAMMDKYDGDVAKVLAAYNAGPGRVDATLKKHGTDWYQHLPAETRAYVKKGLGKIHPRQADEFEAGLRTYWDPAEKRMDDIEADHVKFLEDSRKSFEDVRNAWREVESLANDFDPRGVLDERASQFTDETGTNEYVLNQIQEVQSDYRKYLKDSNDQASADGYLNSALGGIKSLHKISDENWTKLLKVAEENPRDIPYFEEDPRFGLSSTEKLNFNQIYEKANEGQRLSAREKAFLNETGYVQDPVTTRWMPRQKAYDEGFKQWEEKNLTELYDTPSEVREPNIVTQPESKAIDRGEQIFRTIKDVFKDEGGAVKVGRESRVDGKEYAELDPEGKMIKAVRERRPQTAEQRSLYRQARAERAGRIDKIQQEGLGIKGYHSQLKQLQGALPKTEYESLAKHFSEEDIDELLNQITRSNSLLPLEKVKAQTALINLIGGENGSKLPVPSELKLLAEVYSEEFIEALLENRTFMKKLWDGMISTLNVPRAIMSSLDLSAPFRQGIGFVHKKEFWKSFVHMFKLIGSEKASQALMDGIHRRPTWELMKKSGLGIVDPHSHFLAQREEDFMTDYAERIPLYGHVIKASNRTYSGFLNKLRADVFDSYVKQYEKLGINLANDPKLARKVARFVNAATGRGDLGRVGNAAAPALAMGLFSPRLIASRLYMLSPTTYLRADPILRKEGIKAALAYTSLVGLTAGLAKEGLGWEVEDDWRSADFMKPKKGNIRFDTGAGFFQYATLIGRIATGMTKTSKGELKELDGKGINDTRRDVFIRFILNKLAPVPGYFSDMLEGRDPTGKEFHAGEAALSRVIPMYAGDVYDVLQEEGALGIPLVIPGLVGWGSPTVYDANKPRNETTKKKSDNWEEDPAFGGALPSTSSDDWEKDPAFTGA